MSSESFTSVPVPAVKRLPNGSSQPLGIQQSLYYRSTTKQNTVRRAKPVDLFASGTQRQNQKVSQISDMVGMFKLPDGSYYEGPVSCFSQIGNWAAFQPPDVTTLDGKLRSRIKAQNVNLAQTLAEYRQTSSMFASLANDVFRAFRSLRSGRALGDFVRILRKPRTKHEIDIANRWLQYQYGLRPLMQDIYGSAEALASKIRTGFYQHVSTSQSYKSYSKRRQVNVYGMGYFNENLFDGVIRAKARYMVRDATLKQLAQLGISNPALLVWELIPYSFVIDWLFPVGDFLSSLDALVGTSNLKVIYSRTMGETFTTTMDIGGVAQNSSLTYTRFSPSSSLSLPSLRYKPSKSLTAVANGVALLRQLRK